LKTLEQAFPSRLIPVALLAITASLSACATTPVQETPEPAPPPVIALPPPIVKPAPVPTIRASWYGPGFAGHLTSNGERFNPEKLPAASTTIPIGSIVRVMNVENGRTMAVRINDCGPFVPGRSLDLSHRAARELRMTRRGVATVKLLSINTPPHAIPACNF
jgi:rare lipoprotein A